MRYFERAPLYKNGCRNAPASTHFTPGTCDARLPTAAKASSVAPAALPLEAAAAPAAAAPTGGAPAPPKKDIASLGFSSKPAPLPPKPSPLNKSASHQLAGAGHYLSWREQMMKDINSGKKPDPGLLTLLEASLYKLSDEDLRDEFGAMNGMDGRTETTGVSEAGGSFDRSAAFVRIACVFERAERSESRVRGRREASDARIETRGDEGRRA